MYKKEPMKCWSRLTYVTTKPFHAGWHLYEKNKMNDFPVSVNLIPFHCKYFNVNVFKCGATIWTVDHGMLFSSRERV